MKFIYSKPGQKKAFTLIELLITIAIIAIMAAGWGSALSRSHAMGRIITAEASMTLDSAGLEASLINDLSTTTDLSWDAEVGLLSMAPDTSYVLNNNKIIRKRGGSSGVLAEAIKSWQVARHGKLLSISWSSEAGAGQLTRSRDQSLVLLIKDEVSTHNIPESNEMPTKTDEKMSEETE